MSNFDLSGWSTNLSTRQRVERRLRIDEELRLRQDREIRIEEDPYASTLLDVTQVSGNPQYHARLDRLVKSKMVDLARNPDAFRVNLPGPGALSPLTPGRAPLLFLCNDQALTIPLGAKGTSLNTIVVGRTGAGKTNLLMLILVAFAGLAITIIFDRKGGLDRLGQYDLPGGVVILDADCDLQMSFAEGLDFLSPRYHLSQLTDLIASHARIFTSRRLLLHVFHDVLKQYGPSGLTLNRALSELHSIDVTRSSRIGGYRDSVIAALEGIVDRTGMLFNGTGNVLQEMFSRPRIIVVRTGGLATQDATLLATLVYRYVYELRRVRDVNTPPVILAVDDAMPFVSGSKGSESEGNVSPIAEFATLGRALNIGLMVAAQNFSLISPTLKNNSNAVLSLSSFGEDAAALARFMNLTSEQAAMLPLVRPGEAIAIARSEWPLALHGVFPEVK